MEPPSTSTNSSDWETVSEDGSFDRPVLKADVSKLAEVPLKTMLKSKTLEWMAPILSYSHPHKGYELAMVIMTHELYALYASG